LSNKDKSLLLSYRIVS